MARLRLFFLLLMIPTFAMADSYAFVAQTWKWYQSNYNRVQQVLRSKQDPNVLPYVHAIGALYQYREGSIGVEVSPAIALALTHNPTVMLSWFDAHPKVLDQWMERIQSDLLTDYKGTQSAELLRVQKELVTSMRKFESDSPDPGLRQLASRIRNFVEAAKVRGIQ